MALHGMLLQQKLLLGAFILAAAAASQPDSSCNNTCGSLSIPYPFGTSEGCYLDPSFLITCNYSFETPKPFLRRSNIDILDISVLDGELRVSNSVARDCYDESGLVANVVTTKFSVLDFRISYTRNKFTVVGCESYAFITGSGVKKYTTGCTAICDSIDSVENRSCSGIGCCQTLIPEAIWDFSIIVASYDNHSAVRSFNPCGFAFLVDAEAYKFSSLDLQQLEHTETVPLVLDWAVGNETCEDAQRNMRSYACKAGYSYCYNSTNGPGYLCNCSTGFQGNPYLPHGCTDIDECDTPNRCDNETQICNNFLGGFNCSCLEGYEDDGSGTSCRAKVNQSRDIGFALGISSGLGLLVLLVGGWWSYKVVKKRREIKQKNKYFKRNGGLLLQQQLSLHEANVENTKLFNSKDLEKATDYFNVNRILGQGGQGTVFKGMLADGRMVVLKKPKVIDEGKLEEFINEVVILSQINHRNVVKLIGCCLETEVPLLVYEYVPNGTLFQYVNGQMEEFPLTWDMRLRIAIEVVRALFYLHSIASTLIHNRYIKSTNIFLDDKYRAKVADFGTLRSINVDQTQLTTLVHGTFGDLDLEYFQSSQFTENIDVYSFGVVLVELLIGEKTISSTRTQESKSLATYFIQSVEENNLFDIIDSRVLKEDNKEEIIAVANLVKRCLNLNGKKRPTMKEVAVELEAVQMLKKAPKLQNYEELEYVQAKMYKPWDVVSTSTMSTLSLETQPLFSQ